MANSSDPYPPMERELELTRGCIQILKARGISLQMITKSDLVTRDVDLLEDMSSAVSLTLTTLNEALASRLEPRAPSPERRLDAIRLLRSRSVPVSVRLDPIIPGINDAEIADLVHGVALAGAQHITSSTYKARADSWKRLCKAFPEAARSLGAMLEKGRRIGGCQYLPEIIRAKLMLNVREAAIQSGATFSTCREGFAPDPGVSCDGRHLLERTFPDQK